MYSRFIVTIGLAAGLATAVAIPAYSDKNHDHANGAKSQEHTKANPASSTSGVGGAEGCASILDLGCNLTASEMPKMMRQQDELSTKALLIPKKQSHNKSALTK